MVDENTNNHCLPLLKNIEELKTAKIIEIKSGEEQKTIQTTQQIWSYLCDNHANRKSVIINLGGGVLCDMSGFAASTFKRGIDFVNIPTTLLSQVDASIGGKLGIDYKGFKNEIGLFKVPNFVVINSTFLKTINEENFVSGFAEMIKHALIYSSQHWGEIKQFDPYNPDYKKLNKLLTQSVLIKNEFVTNDPREINIRKALNFGHTIGHAIESHFLESDSPLLHGHAIAHGIICETWLSHKKLGLPKRQLNEITGFIRKIYGTVQINKNIYENLHNLMLHDKKNESKKTNFTLLSDIGSVEINMLASKKDIFESLDYYMNV